MKKSYRILYSRTCNEEALQEHLAQIREEIDLIDEISLFVELSHHGYYSLEWLKERAKMLEHCMNEHRKLGIKSVGINVLDTVGHIDEAWDVLEKPPMQTVVGRDGCQSKSCLCINSPEYKDYIKEKYKILAGSNPDFIWVDDDFRIESHGVPDACYCPYCISMFNQVYNHNETIENLDAKLRNDEVILNEWNEFRINQYKQLGKTIRESIYSVNPKIEIGFMCGEWAAKPEWMTALDAVKLRPGGSFYKDTAPTEAVFKVLNTGVQCARATAKIKDIQYEFENFPYEELGKSETIRRFESTLALMVGHNGIAFNAIGQRHGDLSIFDTIRKNNAYWDKIVDYALNKENVGVYSYDIGLNDKFNMIGIPIAFRKENASAFVLTGNKAEFLADTDIFSLLSGGLLIDGQALEILTNRGFGKYCGCKPGKIYTNGMTERFTFDSLNGIYFGYIYDCYMNFPNREPQIPVLEMLSDKTRVLGELVSILGEKTGACTTAYENEIGGRIVVSTYFFPEYLGFLAKRRQIQNIFDWLANGAMPVRIETQHKIAPLVCRNMNNGEEIVMLANCSFDGVENCVVIFDKQYDVSLLEIDGTERKLDTVYENGVTKVNCGSIQPWHEVTLLLRLNQIQK